MNFVNMFYVLSVITIVLFDCVLYGYTQEASFELPVQLVGFPFIILAVRLTNFVKKLSYALNPATYRARTRRGLLGSTDRPDLYDVTEAEKYIVEEFGSQACIYERVCSHYAARSQELTQPEMDWPHIIKQYKHSPDKKKEYYLLSVFLGDIVGSPQLCHQLGKRRSCDLPGVELNR